METNVIFIGPSLADGSYVIFHRLVLANGNCISFIDFFLKTTKVSVADEGFQFSYSDSVIPYILFYLLLLCMEYVLPSQCVLQIPL
jgi:hypothetical protein